MNKEKRQKALEAARKLVADSKAAKVAADQKATEIENQLKNTQNKEKPNMNKYANELRILKQFAKATEQDYATLAKAFLVEKMGTGDINSDLLNDARDTKINLSFDKMEGDLAVISQMTKVDMKGQRSKTIYFDNEDMEAKHIAEGASIKALGDESFTFYGKTIEKQRASLTTSITTELQDMSLVDVTAYVQSKIQKVIGKALIKLAFNGVGSTIGGDAGLTANSIEKNSIGIRKELAALSQKVAVGAALSRAKMLEVFEAAGPIFSQDQSGWAIFAPRAEKVALSGVKRSTLGDKLNESSVWETDYLGVPVVQINALPSAVAADGFVSATGADNVKGHMVLCKLANLNYCVEGVEVVLKYDEDISTYRLTVNFWTGVKFMSDADNQYGVLVHNITRA